jgi:hypothetical protein
VGPGCICIEPRSQHSNWVPVRIEYAVCMLSSRLRLLVAVFAVLAAVALAETAHAQNVSQAAVLAASGLGEGTIPLGVAAGVNYETVSLQLRSSDRLALFIDGLLEARSKTGELYGFERLRALFAASPTAAQASEAALAFGQDDDITVLTLTRTTAEAQHA